MDISASISSPRCTSCHLPEQVRHLECLVAISALTRQERDSDWILRIAGRLLREGLGLEARTRVVIRLGTKESAEGPEGPVSDVHEVSIPLPSGAEALLTVTLLRGSGSAGSGDKERLTAEDRRLVERVADILGSAIGHQLNREVMEARMEDLEGVGMAVSHDLRSPIRAIEGLTRVLGQRYGHELGPSGIECLGHVQESARSAGAMLDSLHNLACSGSGEISRDVVDLSVMAEDIFRALRLREPDREVDWKVQPGLKAYGDPGLLRIVLENLLGNAWKFTGATPDAKIRVGRAEDDLDTFYVRDNGAGFDPAFSRRLFVPFQRLHSRGEFPGSGCGLATVRRLVTRHGGQVKADGEPGRGATFYIRLPKDHRNAAAA